MSMLTIYMYWLIYYLTFRAGHLHKFDCIKSFVNERQLLNM